MKRDLIIYARSSTKRQVEQVNRDSMNRQHKLIEDVALIETHHNCAYKDTFSDKGKSAFKGEHLSRDSELSKIIENSKNGIYKNPIIYIEAWDRLSRLSLRKSKELINKMFDAGLSIIVQKTGIYKLWSINDQDDISSDIQLSIALHQAHEESKNKASRLRQTYQNNLEKGTIRSAMNLPSWIDFNHNTQEYNINEYSVHIHKIFELRLKGYSCLNIARYFNDRGIMIGNNQRGKISETRIKKILQGKQVLGSFVTKGRIIPNFLPQLIDLDTFNRVSSTFNINRTKQTNNIQNLFYGLTLCSNCGASYVSVNTSRNDYSLRCSNRARGVDEESRSCSNRAIRYCSIIEPCLRHYFNRVKIDEILKTEPPIDTTVLQEQIHQQENLLKKLTNLYLTLDDESFLEKSKTCKTEIDRLKAELMQHEPSLHNDSVEWGTIIDHPLDSREDKIAVNAILRRYINKIELQAYNDKKQAKMGCVAIIHWKSGCIVRLQLPSVVNDPDGFETFKRVWG
tara:strand:+ start:283 stop:1815 length:1533 start_codon:yes stop_codon:yes gene_type:complete